MSLLLKKGSVCPRRRSSTTQAPTRRCSAPSTLRYSTDTAPRAPSSWRPSTATSSGNITLRHTAAVVAVRNTYPKTTDASSAAASSWTTEAKWLAHPSRATGRVTASTSSSTPATTCPSTLRVTSTWPSMNCSTYSRSPASPRPTSPTKSWPSRWANAWGATQQSIPHGGWRDRPPTSRTTSMPNIRKRARTGSNNRPIGVSGPTTTVPDSGTSSTSTGTRGGACSTSSTAAQTIRSPTGPASGTSPT